MSLFNVTADGVITVDSSNIKSEMESAYINALGASLNTETGTPEGQMITTDTKLLTYAQNQVVLVANVNNVLTATGTALDVAASFWGYYRKSAVKSTVQATISGAAGIYIAAGSLVSNGTNNFALTTDITIPSGGSVTGIFEAVDDGAVACESGTLTEIITTTDGWDTVYNNTSCALGYEKESDNAFRQRITANWFNIRSTSCLGGIMDTIAQLDGVLSCVVRENTSSDSKTIDGVTLTGHSVYISVVGGDSSEIAQAIASKKAAGIATNGNTTVSYIDSYGVGCNYLIERPDYVDIKVLVKYSANVYTPAGVEDKIKETVMQYVSDNPFKISQAVSGYVLAAALKNFEFADLLSIKVALKDDTEWSDYFDTTMAQIAVLGADNITCEEVSNE